MRREIPEDRSFCFLFGPRTDYLYFAEPGRFRLRPVGDTFDPIAASRLADAALLAYVPDGSFVADALGRIGFDEVAFFDRGSTSAFAAASGSHAIVAFRGTEPGDLEDLKTDLDALLTREAGGRGHVHRGFRKALDLVWADLDAWIGAHAGRDLLLTGHSLGGALATLTAVRRPDAAALYTFGSPRVGSRTFRNSIAIPAFRVVNNADLVARLPTPPLFRHVGTRVFIDRDGEVHVDPDWWDRVRNVVHGDGRDDHSPLHYAIHLWNRLA